MARNSSERSGSDEWFRLIFEAVDDAILILRADDCSILDANSRACETWGYSLKALRALDPGQLGSGASPYTAEEIRAVLHDCSKKQRLSFEWHCKKKNGQLIWIEGAVCLASIGGRTVQIVTCRDKTERKRIEAELELHRNHLVKMVEERSSELESANNTLRSQMLERVQAEELLREREKKYRTILEELTEGFILVDGHGRICEWNTAIEHLSGKPKHTVIGSFFWDTMATLCTKPEHPGPVRESTAEALRRATRETLLSGRTAPLNASLPDLIHKPSGVPISCRMTAFPVGMDTGWHAGLVITRR